MKKQNNQKPASQQVTTTTTTIEKPVKPVNKGRFAVDSIGKKQALKVVEQTSQLATIVDSTGLEMLHNVDVQAVKGVNKNNKPVNILGHQIDASCGFGGKNVRVDQLIIESLTGKVNNQRVYDVLCNSKVSNGKKFGRVEMLNKFKAHIKHYDYRGGVEFQPMVNVDGKKLYAVGCDLLPMVKNVLQNNADLKGKK